MMGRNAGFALLVVGSNPVAGFRRDYGRRNRVIIQTDKYLFTLGI